MNVSDIDRIWNFPFYSQSSSEVRLCVEVIITRCHDTVWLSRGRISRGTLNMEHDWSSLNGTSQHCLGTRIAKTAWTRKRLLNDWLKTIHVLVTPNRQFTTHLLIDRFHSFTLEWSSVAMDPNDTTCAMKTFKKSCLLICLRISIRSADLPDVCVGLPCTSFSLRSAFSQALQCNRDECNCCLSAGVMHAGTLLRTTFHLLETVQSVAISLRHFSHCIQSTSFAHSLTN